ncbi:DUF1869 domain-containing protein [Enterobacteriaceae bacterium H20N1]|uniref:DUF1869 domain-containing protein n=1 Tax=Dryocola boscaweniae TaxID=2925397 RepID=A0A9X2W7H3_9ENTR|nr:DUF1869 domain-containing protein [Dryocola boscaweniae]MCT4701652.1 DUF1869 domain-containing protein [Dryocola boscaweniae]MCT4716296.1 DUF1869 domain-containing protein [Dryocola boscaweniae]MCT4718821.1 DUF1869 domain-containing protein [Dryocola boscaweniae]
MDTSEENKGYTLAVMNRKTGTVAEKIYLKPMALYVPSVAAAAVATLVESIGPSDDCTVCDTGYALSVTNNNNGVSVDKDFKTLAQLAEPDTAADAVKDLINIVRGYDDDEEHNVCGW